MKGKRVLLEMKYIGWNIGAVRIERKESKADIEILELTIDGVDVLKQLDIIKAIKNWHGQKHNDTNFLFQYWQELERLLEGKTC